MTYRGYEGCYSGCFEGDRDASGEVERAWCGPGALVWVAKRHARGEKDGESVSARIEWRKGQSRLRCREVVNPPREQFVIMSYCMEVSRIRRDS